jgi:hypothetical protein
MTNENTMISIKAFEVTQHALSTINTENLISGFDLVGEQTQLLQGKILLEIRKRCNQEGKTLRDFILSLGMTNSSLLKLSTAQRNRLMNLAEFFNDSRPMTGISVTVGYEISAPRNEAIADELYDEAVDKNLTVKDIEEFLRILKNKSEESTIKLDYTRTVSLSEDAKKILEYVNSMNLGEHATIKALKECYTKMAGNAKKPPIDSTASLSIAQQHG